VESTKRAAHIKAVIKTAGMATGPCVARRGRSSPRWRAAALLIDRGAELSPRRFVASVQY
jgi:hypothetical protein